VRSAPPRTLRQWISNSWSSIPLGATSSFAAGKSLEGQTQRWGRGAAASATGSAAAAAVAQQIAALSDRYDLMAARVSNVAQREPRLSTKTSTEEQGKCAGAGPGEYQNWHSAANWATRMLLPRPVLRLPVSQEHMTWFLGFTHSRFQY